MRIARSKQQRISEIARRLGGGIVRLICGSLRLEVLGWQRLKYYLEAGRPLVLQFWHGDMFISWYLTAPLHPAAIVSQAGDGEIASAVLEGLQYKTFRGSSTRGGKKAYLSMLRYLKQQEFKVSAFASDGPRGPYRQMKAGTLMAAQHLDGYVVPVATASQWSVRAHSWDKFALPVPFSRAVASFGKPIKINPQLKGEAFEKELQRISLICKDHQEKLDHYFNPDKR
jgi:lysophospholipid acyltransferase (LPLAT)-like uncharacterized protein